MMFQEQPEAGQGQVQGQNLEQQEQQNSTPLRPTAGFGRFSLFNQKMHSIGGSITSSFQSDQVAQRREKMREGFQTFGGSLRSTFQSDQVAQRREKMREGFQNIGGSIKSTFDSEKVVQRREKVREGLQTIGGSIKSTFESEPVVQRKEKVREGLQTIGGSITSTLKSDQVLQKKEKISESLKTVGGSIKSKLQSDQVVQRTEKVKEGIQTIGGSIKSTFDSDQVAQRREQVKNSLQNAGSKIQQLNLGKIIEKIDPKSDQRGLTNQLESLNERMREERERRDVKRETEAACLLAMEDHLKTFLQANPMGTFEQWIEEFHPENTFEGQLLPGLSKEVDLRFYVEESDHRQLWNRHVSDPVRQVAARTRMWSDNQGPKETFDFLSDQPDPSDQQETIDFLGEQPSETDADGQKTELFDIPFDDGEGDLIQF